MSQSVEWARARSTPRIEEDAGWSDPYGTTVAAGSFGVWLDEVLIEGTPGEFRALADKFEEIASDLESREDEGDD